jgi:hypothetical protein
MIDEIDLQKVARAVSEQYQIERDSMGPKEPYESAPYKGITVSSRYCARHEFNDMRRAIDAMPGLVAARVESIWCDSMACACYTVVLRPGSYTDLVLNALHDAFVEAVGGWNGLVIYGDDRQSHDFDCYWPAG